MTSTSVQFAFRTAHLITASVPHAERAVLEAIDRFDPDRDTEADLLRSAITAAVRRPSGHSRSNHAYQAPELRAVLNLPDDLRRCFVLRVLVQFSPSACAQLLDLTAATVNDYTCAVFKRLARGRSRRSPKSLEGEPTMQFLLLIYDQEKRWAKLTEAQQNSETKEYGAFGEEFADAIRGGNALQPTPTAKTVRVRNGKPQVTDGPFAETKEQLGGYYLVEANDAAEVVKIAAKVPWARYGSIEVRPIQTFS